MPFFIFFVTLVVDTNKYPLKIILLLWLPPSLFPLIPLGVLLLLSLKGEQEQHPAPGGREPVLVFNSNGPEVRGLSLL